MGAVRGGSLVRSIVGSSVTTVARTVRPTQPRTFSTTCAITALDA